MLLTTSRKAGIMDNPCFSVKLESVVRVSDREALQGGLFQTFFPLCVNFPPFIRGDTIEMRYHLFGDVYPDKVLEPGSISEYHEITEVGEPVGQAWVVRKAQFLVAGIFTRLILGIMPTIMEPGYSYKLRAGIRV